MKRFIYVLVLSSLFISCTKDNYDMNKVEKDDKLQQKLTVKEITENAINLRKELFRSSTKGCDNEISVENVQALVRQMTKSENKGNVDTVLYVVNFSNNNGFAVLSADERVSMPFAVTEKGSYNLNTPAITQADSVSKFFLETVANNIIVSRWDNTSTTDGSNLENAGYEIVDLYQHELRTAWDQDGVYFEGTGEKYAGCVATALAQIFTHYYGVLDPLYIYGNKINFQNLLDESIASGDGTLSSNSNSESREDVAALQLWIGKSSGADYNNDGTPIDPKKALKFAKSLGFETAPDRYTYDADRILSGLLENKITYMDGTDEARYFIFEDWDWPVGGHAWVVDGYAKVKKNGQTHNLLHVNWGWGGYKNGYYYAGIFDSSNFPIVESGSIVSKPEIKPDITKANNDGNYCFFLKMSHVYPASWRK